MCHGRTDRRRLSQGERCRSRYIPARQLDEVVWTDLCRVLTDPEQLETALQRAQSGAWLPQEVQARQANVRHAIAGLERQQERLLTAYLGEIVQLPEFERKRRELDQKMTSLRAQHQQLEALAGQRRELQQIAASMETFCSQFRTGLEVATFEQKRRLMELLVDQVVVTDEEVEIRYVMPTSPNGARQPFCQLRLDYENVVESQRDAFDVLVKEDADVGVIAVQLIEKLGDRQILDWAQSVVTHDAYHPPGMWPVAARVRSVGRRDCHTGIDCFRCSRILPTYVAE